MVTLGDSVPAGTGCGCTAFPELYARRQGAVSINLAAPGLTSADVRAQLEVNAVAPLRVVKALRGNLRAGGKIALITSRMGSIGDNGSGGAYGYRMSKAALNAAGMSLARDLKGSGIAVAILHPGWVRTEMTDHTGNIDAAGAAQQLVERLDGLTLETTGTFWHANGQTLPW